MLKKTRTPLSKKSKHELSIRKNILLDQSKKKSLKELMEEDNRLLAEISQKEGYDVIQKNGGWMAGGKWLTVMHKPE